MPLISLGRKYIIMLVTSVILGAAIIIIQFSGVFKLHTVTVEPNSLKENCQPLDLAIGGNLFGAPLESVADDLLNNGKVMRVDIDFEFPDAIAIKINEIKPLALVLADDGKTIYRLDDAGCLLPDDTINERYDFPIITGLSPCRSYRKTGDERMKLVIDQLRQLRKDCFNFYLAISNIDMSDSEVISIYMDGLTFPVETYAGSLYRSIINLKTFLLDFNPNLNGIKRLDMKSDGLIIAAG